MYSMPRNWPAQKIERLVGAQVEHPLDTKQRNIAWENSALRVECNRVHNVLTLEDELAVRIAPSEEPYYTAIVLPRSTDNRFHLVGRYRYPVGRWSVEFPRFDLENGDAGWRDAAADDLFRIAGLSTERMTLLGAIHLDPSLLTTMAVVILAEGCQLAARSRQTPPASAPSTADEQNQEPDQLVAGSVALPQEELFELIQQGEILCSVSLAALTVYRASQAKQRK